MIRTGRKYVNFVHVCAVISFDIAVMCYGNVYWCHCHVYWQNMYKISIVDAYNMAALVFFFTGSGLVYFT